MNRFLWQIIQEEDRTGKNTDLKVSYRHGHDEVLRGDEIDVVYRFEDIFQEYINHKAEVLEKGTYFEEEEYEDIENKLLHFLGKTDLIRGMSKEYHISHLILQELSKYFDLRVFEKEEANRIVYYYKRVKRAGDALKCFKNVIEEIFGGMANLYYMDGKILLIIDRYKSDENLKKYKIIEEIFIDITNEVRVFWKYPFGIIGEDKMMIMDAMELY